MDVGDFALYAWLFPVVFQIVLPLAVFCGWTVIRIPLLLLGRHGTEETLGKEVFAS